jgi:YVTN family beta-propeller protein
MHLLICLLLFTGGLMAQEPVLLVLLKGASAVGYYTLEGKFLGKVDVDPHPHEMVVSRDGRFLFTTDNGTMRIEHKGNGGNTVSMIDIAARKRAARISTEKFFRPHGISVDPVNGMIAVTSEFPDRVLLIDPARRKLIRNFDSKGKTTHMVSFGPSKQGAEHAFASNSGEDTVSVVQLTTGHVKKITTGQRPEGSVLSPDGAYLYVTNRDANTVTIIDTQRQAALGEFKASRGPVRIGVTPDGKTLIWAAMHDHVIEFADLDTRTVTGRIKVEGQPVSLTVSADGRYAFASAEEQDTVYIIDVPGRKLLRQFKTEKGWGPDPVLLWPSPAK